MTGPVSPSTQPQLTPANIADLRACPLTGQRDGMGESAVACITYVPADHAWAIHANGRCWGVTPSIEVAGAALIAERAEPGFLARVLLDTSLNVEQTLLDAQGRADARARNAAHTAALRAAEADREARRREQARRTRPEDIQHISLDMLLRPKMDQ